jgi:hypothetical protein
MEDVCVAAELQLFWLNPGKLHLYGLRLSSETGAWVRKAKWLQECQPDVLDKGSFVKANFQQFYCFVEVDLYCWRYDQWVPGSHRS